MVQPPDPPSPPDPGPHMSMSGDAHAELIRARILEPPSHPGPIAQLGR